MTGMAGYTDADFRRTVVAALRLLTAVALVAAALVGWKAGWGSAALLLVGAAISGTGLYEWLRVMTAVMARMEGGEMARPMGLLLAGFFLRLGGALAVLYVSLRYLHGSVWALAAGLLLGVFALTVEGLRLMKAWTV